MTNYTTELKNLSSEVPTSVTLNLTNYVCRGVATIKLWDCSTIEVCMDSYYINTLDIQAILNGVNDGKYGCQYVEKAEVSIYANYEGEERYLTTLEFSKEELGNAKRGI